MRSYIRIEKMPFGAELVSGELKRVNEPHFALSLERRNEDGNIVWETPYSRTTNGPVENLAADIVEKGYGNARREYVNLSSAETAAIDGALASHRS